MTNYLKNVYELFRNIVLNAVGAERDLYALLQDKDVDKAINLMLNRDEDVDEAVKEYNPQTHDVMDRPDKFRDGKTPYITEKLPRTRQRYINETELFFLLGNPIVWTKKDGDNEAYEMFTKFLKTTHFESRMRSAKRLAGAETESAKLYNIYKDGNGKIQCNVAILARTTGYTLRPMFDRYGNLTAFGYGYKEKQDGKEIQHWDIHTAQFIFYCTKEPLGWKVEMQQNPTGKINIIYYRQNKAWEGVEPRIGREEMLDSKIGDTNNYFAEPIAKATADVVDMLGDPDTPARMIQMSKDGQFEYITPPASSELQQREKENLKESILFDTFTPDFSFETLKGFGTLSGAAIRNAMILGYIKRARNMETYNEMVEREKNLIITILKYMHPDMQSNFDSLEIGFEFAEPFPDDVDSRYDRIEKLYSAGLISLETAVETLSLTDKSEDEIDRIRLAAMESGENKADDIESEGDKQTKTLEK